MGYNVYNHNIRNKPICLSRVFPHTSTLLLPKFSCAGFYLSFVLIQKKQKIKAGTIIARSCRTAMFIFCTTVTSTLVTCLPQAGSTL